MQVVPDKSCTVLGNIYCVRQNWHGLVTVGVIIGGAYSHIAMTGYKIHCISQNI